MTFGEKLKKLRTQRGFTQEELAEKIYVTRTAVSKWESDRGYPNIESLKAIAKCFSVTVDELLSTDEVLTIAEADNKRMEKHFRDLLYGMLDISISLLFFLPFFAQESDVGLKSVSLIFLEGVQSYLKIAFFTVIIGINLTGVLTLILTNTKWQMWLKMKTEVSLLFGTAAVLLFIISQQPYAAVFTFVLLSIKVIMIIKR